MSAVPRRRALVAAIGSPCPYCGRVMQIPDHAPSRDHIKPRSKGHALDGNLALVCSRCNTDKGSLSLGQWLTRLVRAGDPRADHVETFMRANRVPLDFKWAYPKPDALSMPTDHHRPAAPVSALSETRFINPKTRKEGHAPRITERLLAPVGRRGRHGLQR